MNPTDLRHLAPPEPMEVILDALETLPPYQTLSFVLPHHPLPLYPFLEAEGASWRCELSGDGGVVIHISKP
jgi:uncharacterized protein (DUF2249 family)